MRSSAPGKNRKPNSLFNKLVLPLIFLIIMQAGVFLAANYGTGINRRLTGESYQLLSNQVERAATELEYYLKNAAENMRITALTANRLMLDTLAENGIDPAALRNHPEAIDLLLNDSMTVIHEYLMRNNRASGVFVMLDASISPDSGNIAGLYIRDTEPQVFLPNYADWLLERGPAAYAREYNFALDSGWSYEHDLSLVPDSDAFFTEPMRMALESDDPSLISYWSGPFRLSPNGPQVITFTAPLLAGDGTPFGVFGIEISASILSDLMPSFQLNSMQGFYLITPGEGLTDAWTLANGQLAVRFIEAAPEPSPGEVIGDIAVSFYTTDTDALASVASISRGVPLYRLDMAAEGRSWTLHGFVPRHQVQDSAARVNQATMLSLLIAFVAALLMLIFIANNITRPVSRLSRQLETLDTNKPVKVASTGIREVDDLTGALERLSVRAVTAASRLSTIVRMVGMSMGGFEEDYELGRVFLTETLTELLPLDVPGDGYMPLSEWRPFLEKLRAVPEPGYENVYLLNDGKSRFLRIESHEQEGGMFGVIVDVTSDVLEKRRLEYERDYDALTGLPNRRFFREKAQEILELQPDLTGAVIFCDLDDLKYVNDTYGHDSGDAYLRMMARALQSFTDYGGLVARVSGDEYIVLLHGFRNAAEIRNVIRDVFEESQKAFFNLPDGSKQGLRFSTGISWFPQDSRSLDTLVRYADFAMSEVKKTNKGIIGVFNQATYENKSFLTDKFELFNLMLEEKQLAFAMQPIVNARTGEVDAYEALMRPLTPGLRSPLEVLQLAVAQSKLYRVERLVMFTIFEWLDRHIMELDGRLILFNTIASQKLTDEDDDKLYEYYGHLMKHTVMEITESEQASPDTLDTKIKSFREYGGRVAIDDYGSGYSNELIILMAKPDMIKIDMTIIRDVDHDPNRQQIVKNAIAYAKPRGIMVLGEGVETFEEMKYLIELGVDYLQGYYLGKPKFTLDDISEQVRDQIRDIAKKAAETELFIDATSL